MVNSPTMFRWGISKSKNNIPSLPFIYLFILGALTASQYSNQATGWTIGSFKSRQGRKTFHFSKRSMPAVGPTLPPIQWVSGVLYPNVKRPEREDNHSPPSGEEVKNKWNYTSTSLRVFRGFTRTTLRFIYSFIYLFIYLVTQSKDETNRSSGRIRVTNAFETTREAMTTASLQIRSQHLPQPEFCVL
jgi:hypothetical protein